MDLWNMMTVLQLQPLKWLMMFPILSTSSKEEMGLKDQTKKSETTCNFIKIKAKINCF